MLGTNQIARTLYAMSLGKDYTKEIPVMKEKISLLSESLSDVRENNHYLLNVLSDVASNHKQDLQWLQNVMLLNGVYTEDSEYINEFKKTETEKKHFVLKEAEIEQNGNVIDSLNEKKLVLPEQESITEQEEKLMKQGKIEDDRFNEEMDRKQEQIYHNMRPDTELFRHPKSF